MSVGKFSGWKGELYYKGEWQEALFEKCVAVVGSRRMTSYGERVIEKLVPQLVNEGWTIVSGFMYGVDQAAHRTCLEVGGKTIAVVGWGINETLDASDQILGDQIIKSGGLLISEWEDQKPAQWTFPARNKIVAAMAERIYVIEAASKSGALITAEMGRNLGKEIWAVPGPVTSAVSAGTNWLIKTGRAKMWVPGESISRGTKTGDLYILLQNETLTVDELVRKTGRSVQEVGSELTMMILSGEAAEEEGKYYLVE